VLSLESTLNGSRVKITSKEGAAVSTERKHVFISHHFADDGSVDALTTLIRKGGWDVRNSSIRLKDANRQRLEKGEIADSTLRRALRMKIAWAQTTVVLIGKETHNRKWVNYEIEEAHRLGKPIVGIYARGNQDAEVPAALESYATSVVAWNTESIMSAISGALDTFQTPDGLVRPSTNDSDHRTC